MIAGGQIATAGYFKKPNNVTLFRAGPSPAPDRVKAPASRTSAAQFT